MSIELDTVRVAVPDGDTTLTILDGATVHVGAGEVVAVTGASGSGKSTLLSVAGLLRRPDSGRVLVDGRDVTDLRAAERTGVRGASIGLVFQSSNLFPSLTAVEQVELVAHIAGRLDGPARQRARELLVAVGLEGKTDRRPAHLSGGERQRVGVARALMNEPTVLLADEPTASLDATKAQEVMDVLVDQARARGIAALVVTHAPEQVRGPDRRLHLEQGRLVEVDRVA